MIVVCDSNEEATNPTVVSYLRNAFPKLEVSALSFGDLNIIFDNGDILAIERKNVNDFLGSVGDGRVFRQVENMANGAKFYCVIVCGRMGFDENDMVTIEGRETNWRGASIRGAMYALQWSGCPVLWTESERSYPWVVGEAMNFCAKPEQHFQTLGHHRIVTFPPVELSVEILSAFPGIGLKRAKSLIEFVGSTRYNSLAGAIAWASTFPLLKEGQRPEGWGNKSVENFRAMLGLASTQFMEIKENINGTKKKE